MVDEKSTTSSYSFVNGDFNVSPTANSPWNEGYFKMVDNGNYTDTYLAVNEDANNRPPQSIHNTTPGNGTGRIDFIFMKANSVFDIVDSQIIFKPNIVGLVSDHYGVLTKVKLK